MLPFHLCCSDRFNACQVRPNEVRGKNISLPLIPLISEESTTLTFRPIIQSSLLSGAARGKNSLSATMRDNCDSYRPTFGDSVSELKIPQTVINQSPSFPGPYIFISQSTCLGIPWKEVSHFYITLQYSCVLLSDALLRAQARHLKCQGLINLPAIWSYFLVSDAARTSI